MTEINEPDYIKRFEIRPADIGGYYLIEWPNGMGERNRGHFDTQDQAIKVAKHLKQESVFI